MLKRFRIRKVWGWDKHEDYIRSFGTWVLLGKAIYSKQSDKRFPRKRLA